MRVLKLGLAEGAMVGSWEGGRIGVGDNGIGCLERKGRKRGREGRPGMAAISGCVAFLFLLFLSANAVLKVYVSSTTTFQSR